MPDLYPARPIPFNPREYATHQSMQCAAAFAEGARISDRQAAIEYAVAAHGFSKVHTKSLLYVAGLNSAGRNVRGDIQIGPAAFAQDLPWLAGVVFHELVHSPQHAYYASKGVTGIDPTRSDIERLMIAVDEYEAYWWSLKRSEALGLSSSQRFEIHRREQFALVDVDDAKILGLVRRQRFDEARDELIRQYTSSAPGARGASSRRHAVACYA